jgi:hypothetical protein
LPQIAQEELVADKVLVYRYMYWVEATRVRETSQMYATVEVIRDGLGTPVHSSALEVSRSELRDGMYVPLQDALAVCSRESSASN